MPSPFAITTTTNQIRLGANRQGTVVFTVFNASGSPIQGRAVLTPQGEASSDWLSLAGEAEEDMPVAGTAQFTVQIAPPADAPAGSYAFRLDMVDVENPDENYTEGQAVTVEIPAVQPKPFPWWILAVAGGIVVVGAVLAIVLWPRKVRMPEVSGIPLADARATLTLEGLRVGSTVEAAGGGLSSGYVVASTPEKDTVLTPESTVVLAVVPGPTPTPKPTNTPRPTRTPRPTKTPKPTNTPTHTPTPTRVVGSEMKDFVGTWVNTNKNATAMTKLVIQKVNNTIISVDAFSKVFRREIGWGTKNVPFTPKKIIITQEFKDSDGKVVLKRTTALERSGKQLVAEVFSDYDPSLSQKDRTTTHTFNKRLVMEKIVTPISPPMIDKGIIIKPAITPKP